MAVRLRVVPASHSYAVSIAGTGEELRPHSTPRCLLLPCLQVNDMRSTSKLQRDILQQCTIEARELMTQLTQLVDTVGQVGLPGRSCGPRGRSSWAARAVMWASR